MRADEFHEHQPGVVGQRHHQAVVIALDVEDRAPVLQDAGAAVLRLDVSGLLPLLLSGSIALMPGDDEQRASICGWAVKADPGSHHKVHLHPSSRPVSTQL